MILPLSRSVGEGRICTDASLKKMGVFVKPRRFRLDRRESEVCLQGKKKGTSSLTTRSRKPLRTPSESEPYSFSKRKTESFNSWVGLEMKILEMFFLSDIVEGCGGCKRWWVWKELAAG